MTLGATALWRSRSAFRLAATIISEAADPSEQGRALGSNQSLQVGAEALTGLLAEGSWPAHLRTYLPLNIRRMAALAAGAPAWLLPRAQPAYDASRARGAPPRDGTAPPIGTRWLPCRTMTLTPQLPIHRPMRVREGAVHRQRRHFTPPRDCHCHNCQRRTGTSCAATRGWRSKRSPRSPRAPSGSCRARQPKGGQASWYRVSCGGHIHSRPDGADRRVRPDGLDRRGSRYPTEPPPMGQPAAPWEPISRGRAARFRRSRPARPTRTEGAGRWPTTEVPTGNCAPRTCTQIRAALDDHVQRLSWPRERIERYRTCAAARTVDLRARALAVPRGEDARTLIRRRRRRPISPAWS